MTSIASVRLPLLLGVLLLQASLLLPDAAARSTIRNQATMPRAAELATQQEDGMSNAERGLVREIAAHNLAEIKMAGLALAISENPKVRGYAQLLLDDHGKAKVALRMLAERKGVVLPGGVETEHAAILNQLALMRGQEFDQKFMAAAGLEGHQQSRQLLERASKAGDPHLKDFATRQIGVIDKHLATAKQLIGPQVAANAAGAAPAPAASAASTPAPAAAQGATAASANAASAPATAAPAASAGNATAPTPAAAPAPTSGAGAGTGTASAAGTGPAPASAK